MYETTYRRDFQAPIRQNDNFLPTDNQSTKPKKAQNAASPPPTTTKNFPEFNDFLYRTEWTALGPRGPAITRSLIPAVMTPQEEELLTKVTQEPEFNYMQTRVLQPENGQGF